MEHVETKEQVADIFTKLLPKETFECSRRSWDFFLSPLESRGSIG